jgi:hypothetical protein
VVQVPHRNEHIRALQELYLLLTPNTRI